MKPCKAHHKKYRHHKHGKVANMHNMQPANGDKILNRVVSLLLTGIEMAIFGKAAKAPVQVAQSANFTTASNPNRGSKRKKCGSCNGKDCATCLKI